MRFTEVAGRLRYSFAARGIDQGIDQALIGR
jgi:hypothetical protein